MTDEEAKRMLEEKARKMAETTEKIAAETLKEQAKDKVKDAVLDHLPYGEVLKGLGEVLDHPLNAAPEVKDNLKVLGEHAKVVVPVVTAVLLKQGIEAVKQVAEKDGPDIEERLKATIRDVEKTPEELADIEAQHRVDEENHKILDANLEKLQAEFDKRHPDTESANTRKLQEELEKKFEELRRQQLRRLADRMGPADGRGR